MEVKFVFVIAVGGGIFHGDPGEIHEAAAVVCLTKRWAPPLLLDYLEYKPGLDYYQDISCECFMSSYSCI